MEIPVGLGGETGAPLAAGGGEMLGEALGGVDGVVGQVAQVGLVLGDAMALGSGLGQVHLLLDLLLGGGFGARALGVGATALATRGLGGFRLHRLDLGRLAHSLRLLEEFFRLGEVFSG